MHFCPDSDEICNSGSPQWARFTVLHLVVWTHYCNATPPHIISPLSTVLLQWIFCHSISPMQYYQWWRSQRLSQGLWWETPPPSPALSTEATPWAIPTHGCTTTPSLSVKLATCWLSVSWENLMLVFTAVRWPTLLDWLGVTLLPLNLEVNIGNVHTIIN